MLQLACALALHKVQTADYMPHGPQIIVTMKKGGSFTITTDPKASPKTVAQIIDLVKHKFYNGLRVHRVEYWVTQWGDPISRDKPMTDPEMGDGGSGKALPFEMSDIDFKRGVVGVASEGLQMGGDSQLFVIKQDRLYLYHSYAVVGKVTDGMDVVDKIDKGDRIESMVLASEIGHGAPIRAIRPKLSWQGGKARKSRKHGHRL